MMSPYIKSGVDCSGMQHAALHIILTVFKVYEESDEKFTITSICDGKHSANSLHYKGRAVDFRTKTIQGNKHDIAATIRQRLGSDYDVIFEAAGTPNEHFHVEFDPKG